MVRGSAHNPTTLTPQDHYSTVWDPLRGQGPSSAERYNDPLNVKPAAFPSKPGWKALRHQADIKQDQERLQIEADREAKREVRQTVVRQAAVDRQLNHGFNPITGQEYNKATSSWQPASDPWQHQRVGTRPVHTIKAIEAAGSTGTLPGRSRAEALAPVVEMRRERIANGGLSAAQRRHGGVKELMQWGS